MAEQQFQRNQYYCSDRRFIQLYRTSRNSQTLGHKLRCLYEIKDNTEIQYGKHRCTEVPERSNKIKGLLVFLNLPRNCSEINETDLH
jgi:hypothetical protein